MRFEVRVRITHEPAGTEGVRRLPAPRVSVHGPFANRAEADALIDTIWSAAKAGQMQYYLKTEVRPVD
jgi:hypothetical protein